MNSPWGPQSSSKFSRDDEQIFALNYENLCDIEYLNKLFASEIAIQPEQLSSHPWMLTPDLPEDIVLFGAQNKVGAQFIYQRSLYDDAPHGRLLDNHTDIILRQIKVYAHIGRMVALKCSEVSQSRDILAEISLNASSRQSAYFLPNALTCALQIIENSSRKNFSRSSLNAIVSLTSEIFHNCGSRNLSSEREFNMSPMHAHLLRTALCKGMQQGLSLRENTAAPEDILRGLKLSMSCAFCLFKVGMHAHSSTDVLLAMSHMLAVSIRIEDQRVEVDAQIMSIDSEFIIQEKSRMKSKLSEYRLNIKGSSVSPPHSVEDFPTREPPVSGFDIKLGSAKTSWDKPILKSAVGKDWKVKLQTEKFPVRPERDHYGDDGGKDNQSGGSTSTNISGSGDVYPVSSWRCSVSSDNFVKKVLPSTACSKVMTPTKNHNVSSVCLPVSLNAALPPGTFEGLHLRRQASASLETLNIIPKDVINEVNAFCVGVKEGGTLSKTQNHSRSIPGVSRGMASTAIWTCGQNSYGELGHGDVNLRRSFAKSSYFNDKNISCVGAGNEHSVFVSSGGKTYVAGYNDNGQCGTGTTQQVRQPALVSFLEDEDISKVYVFNGCEHTLVATTEGKMFSFGYNYRGQLGVGNTCSEPVPRPIRGLLSRKVAMAACSYHHSIVSCVDGTVFSFGRNDCGQLGHGDTADKKIPCIVNGIVGPIISVSCGQFHTIIVTKSGSAYSCGKNDYGQLGLESSESVKQFSAISACPDGDGMRQVCCGYYHSILLSRSGGVYGFGRNDYGQLGLGHTQPRMYGTTPILYLRDKNVLSLAAGCYHSVAVTTNGMLYVFGRNNHGQLGTGDVDERHFPHPVDHFVGKNIIQVAAGFYHTIVLLATQGVSNQENFDVASKPADLMDTLPCRSMNKDKPFEGDHLPNGEGLLNGTTESLERSDESSLSNNNGDSAVKVLSSLSGVNVEFRDLFVFTIAHLEQSLDTSNAPGHISSPMWSVGMKCEDLTIGVNWASLQLNIFSVLLQLCRQYLNGSLAIDLPFSQDEILSILGTVVNLLEQFMAGLDGTRMLHLCKLSSYCLDEESVSEVLAHYSPSFPVFSFEYIVKKLATPSSSNEHDSSSTINDATRLSGEISSARETVTESIRNIRQELMFVYFYLPETFDVCPIIGQQCGKIISNNFDFLFWSPSLQVNMFSFLSEVLTEAPPASVDLFDSSFTSLSVEMEAVDYSRCLSLLTKVCFKYKNLSEVVDLFRSSPSQGLEIYFEVIKIYHHMSIIRVKNLCDGVSGQEASDAGRTINMLEYCCAHFTKCAVPHMFTDPIDSKDVSLVTTGRSIRENMFYTIETIIDTLSVLGKSDENKGIVNCEANMPIIFPTLLLYALSNVEVAHFRLDVSHSLPRLIGKLQILIKTLELDCNSMHRVSLSSKSRANETQPLSRATSDANPQNKDFSQSPWWIRVLKLCSILSAKISHILISGSGSAPPSAGVFSGHAVWESFTGPEEVSKFYYLLNAERKIPSVEAPCEWRHIVTPGNHTYRTIISAASANNTVSILNGIESCLIGAVRLRNQRQDIVLPEAEAIASLTIYIFNQRSILMSRCDGLAWKDILWMIFNIFGAFESFLRSCADKACVRPLILPAKKRVHSAMRRSLLVILCLNRWKSSLRLKLKARNTSIISAFQHVLNQTVLNINPLSERSLQTSWRELLNSLQRSADVHTNQAIGMQIARELFENAPQPSIRIDVLSLLTVSWKNMMTPKSSSTCEDKEVLVNSSKSGHVLLYSTPAANCSHKMAYQLLMDVIQNSVMDFCNKLHEGTISSGCMFTELNLFYCNIKFLQLVLSHKNIPYSHKQFICTLKNLREVLVTIDHKFTALQVNDDRGSSGASASKRQSSREKCAHMRRAASAVVRLLQIVAVNTMESGDEMSKEDFSSILDVHIDLIKHFQNTRVSMISDSIASSRNDTKDGGRGKEASSHRKRCQELIVNPMQFSRIQEGYVVQGEKLLSNFKGIDFTLACWVFITKKTASRSSFLMGKVSHNDAWPLVTLRAADMKAEIIFGRANEFERLSSHAALPLHTWTHMAVVVEPRKIKLFINGSMDCQVTTAGNARAILYPVIIGACPSGVRTRVDCIKEGFDGLLSSLKYYTRALSPIHVRVIFDKGPPEAQDARENLCYHLLAASTLMLDSNILRQVPQRCCDLLETCHILFLSDSNRLRLGALKVFQTVLSHRIVENFSLAQNEFSIIPKLQPEGCGHQRKTLMTAGFLGSFATFEEKLIFYFIRLMGICWYSSTSKKSDSDGSYTLFSDDNACGSLKEFLCHCPSFISYGSMDVGAEGGGVASEGGAIEVPIPREDLIIEMCQAINQMLRPLSHIVPWTRAISRVLQVCTSTYLSQTRQDMAVFANIDMFGVAVFVGELPLCPFLGAEVQSSYCEHPGTVLSIDKATCQSTVLTFNASKSNIQVITMKTNELSGLTESRNDLQLSKEFNTAMITLIVKLSEGVGCIMTDCLSVSSRDQSFTHDYILKTCRPYEVFLFHQLIRRLSCSVKDCIEQRVLFNVLKPFSIRASNNRRQVTAASGQLGGQISLMWIRSLNFISSSFLHPNEEQLAGLSSCTDESELCESVLSTHLDISPDCFKSQYGGLLKSGYVTEFMQCASSTEDTDVASLVPKDIESSSRVFTVDISSLASRNGSPDAKAKLFFQMMFELRELTIKYVRKVVHMEYLRTDSSLRNSLELPWKIAIWQSLVKEKETVVRSAEHQGLLRLCTLLQSSDGPGLTSSVIGSIQYGLMTLFRRKSSGLFDMSDNILRSTDVFNRLLLSSFTWIRSHVNLPTEAAVCFEFLSSCLPLLPLVKGLECEVSILSLCALAVQRIVIRFYYSGDYISEDMSRLVKSDIFSSLWARTEEHLVSERGHSTHTFLTATQHLASIACGFSILQRSALPVLEFSGAAQSEIGPVREAKHAEVAATAREDLCNISLLPIEISASHSHSAEFDLSVAFQGKGDTKGEVVMVQVALCVHGDEADSADGNAFETIYYGSVMRFVHYGLSPSSLYCVKYRFVLNSAPDLCMSSWSDVTEFRTEGGTTPFVFDTMRCGPDIIVNNDGRIASYSGDDNWSTVLGSTPFTSGINSWEVKIVTSSTAYIFVGIASSAADLNTFLGGCSDGWGFIGEQALYHGREKVKIYGEPFSAGDIVGVILDFNSGTLSFTKNGKTLGIAFDKIYGELFPAIAFYNIGQEVEIVSDSFRTFCPPAPFPCSPSNVNLDQFSLLSEMMYCVSMRTPFSVRVLDMILTHLKSWCGGQVLRKKAVSGKYIFLNKDSPLLVKLDLKFGDRVRTQYGIADICGSAYGRVWFSTKDSDGAWYFSKQQITAGRAKGLFQRCSYDSEHRKRIIVSAENSLHSDVDVSSLQEYLDPSRWSTDIDNVLVNFLQETAEKENISLWDISSQLVCDNFRKIQLNFSRFVMNSVELSHKWGISGPKRKAVLARLAVIRLYNHLMEHTLPLLLPSVTFGSSPVSNIRGDDLSFTCVSTPHAEPSAFKANVQGTTFAKSGKFSSSGVAEWPIYNMSWQHTLPQLTNCSPAALCSMTRNIIFSDLKRSHFWKILRTSTARVSKTDDDYDYPEDLPLVKLNRFRSFRAVEVAEQQNISGEDLILTSMFCQLWKELRQHSPQKLRISYTHPMDDGQSRTFKVRFEGEGVDDYGGPYREVFQKICEELKVLDTATAPPSDQVESFSKCFIPILHPTPNWNAEDCVERYKFTFLPFSSSALSVDLFQFLGQLVGMALRSKITLELPLASYIWKSVVRQPLSNQDLSSFDAPASRFVEYLGSMHQKIENVEVAGSQEESLSSLTEELEVVLQDVTWTVTFSNGLTNNLVEGGHLKNVQIDDVGEYLQLYTEARLGESYTAVEAFREGLLWVVPESAISMLAWDELEYLVCGSKSIDVERLKRNTEYDDDISPADQHIIDFWDILECFSEEEKSSFLRFVWARPTLPPNGIDFPQKLKVQSAVGEDSSASPNSYLPKAHTCFFSINLPRYTSKEIMKERLLYAITHCTEMDADFRVTEEEVVGWSSLPAAQNWTSVSGE